MRAGNWKIDSIEIEPFIFQVTGAPVPSYFYEFTSAEFGRNAEGQLEVTNGGLDRDPPNQPVLVVQVSKYFNSLMMKIPSAVQFWWLQVIRQQQQHSTFPSGKWLFGWRQWGC